MATPYQFSSGVRFTASSAQQRRLEPLHMMLVLLLLVSCASSTWGVVPRKLAVSVPVKMDVFTEADLATAISRSNTGKVPVTATVKSNIGLTRVLPRLGVGASVSLVGGCVDSKKKPVRCVIDGADEFSVFVAVNNSCTVSLQGLTFQHVVNGVVQGYCNVTARNCLFTNNRADNIGGAVINMGTAEQPWGPNLLTILIRYCNFSNNVANAADTDGGAISVQPVGMAWDVTVDVAFSSFRDNYALGGSGGAIGNSAGKIILRGVEFLRNAAARSGGAIMTRAEVLLSYNCTFTSNSAGRGDRAWGGAVSVESFISDGDVLFCGTKFSDNRSPEDGGNSANVLFEGDYSSRLAFCPSVPATGVRGRRTDGDYEYDKDWATTDCIGCSGCTKDCNGNGKCVTSADFITTCACNEGYDADTQCSKCLRFRNITTQCKTCFTGFVPGGKGKGCVGCPGLEQIPYVANIGVYSDSVKLTSAASCAQLFSKTKQNLENTPHWNVWAYIDKSAPMPACRESCVLFNNNIDKPLCDSDRKVHTMPKYGLTFVGDEIPEHMQPSPWNPGLCGPRQ